MGEAVAWLGAERPEDDLVARVRDYMARLALHTGKGPDGFPAAYSLYWYYKHCLALDMANPDCAVLRMLMGYDLPEVRQPAPADPAEAALIDFELANSFGVSGAHPLNASQRMAVHKALAFPLSIIKGPPGTGKTEVIVRMVALAAQRGWRVGVVSTNHSAVTNVVEKIVAFAPEAQGQGAGAAATRDLVVELAGKLAVLGNSQERTAACDLATGAPFGFKSGKHANGVKGWEKKITMAAFMQDHPVVTSTIHSIKKCFADGDVAKFDLLVVDESSQANLIAGMVAASCARHVVIVGDEEQLPPIVNVESETAERLALTLDGVGAPRGRRAAGVIYDLGEGTFFSSRGYKAWDFSNSLLDLCYARLGIDPSAVEKNDPTSPLTMLNEHYRCHPKIIGFCSQAFYGGRLEVRTPQPADSAERVPLPIRVLWYQGDYAESHWCKEQRDRTGKLLPRRASKINRRQIAIMREREFPHIAELLSGEGGAERSVCILSPYFGEVEELTDALNAYLDERGINDRAEVGELEPQEGARGRGPLALTIHKSQGQEFDCVYLLPVEDNDWEWPWSQGRRIVNVAVSRAKRELVVVASTMLMSHGLQMELAGRIAPASDPAREEDDPEREWMFVRKLIDYVAAEEAALSDADRARNRELGYGIVAAEYDSVFDDVPQWRAFLAAERDAVVDARCPSQGEVGVGGGPGRRA